MTSQCLTGYFLPGEKISDIKTKENQVIKGPGLKSDSNELVTTQAGRLYFRAPNTYWMETRKKRYVPKKGDLVIGIVTKKSGDTLKIDIGSAESACLSMLAFEGATKKIKPDVSVGDIVYAKVLNAYKEMEPELVCIDKYYKAGRLGVLPNEGFLMGVSERLTHLLLNPTNPFLRKLSQKFPFEIVIGINGKVWIKAARTADILMLSRILKAAESVSEKQIVTCCK